MYQVNTWYYSSAVAAACTLVTVILEVWELLAFPYNAWRCVPSCDTSWMMRM
jgi:hypothetical protein